jgi:hypothetical protein
MIDRHAIEVARLTAQVRDLKARLCEVAAITAELRSSGAWPDLDAAFDLHVKNWSVKNWRRK